MTQPIARLGDLTNHGGTVLTSAINTLAEGKPVARMGDVASCPQHGLTTIITGHPKTIVEGKPVARMGDQTACGAMIITGTLKILA